MSALGGGRSSRRDSERLASLLEDGGAVATATEEDRVLAQLAEALRAVPTDVPPMRQEFREELRASLLDAAREQRRDPALLTRLRDGARRMRYSTAALTGASTAAAVLSGGGVALAAEYAQPDDLLYDVKLALEDLRLGLTFDEVARGERAMSYAFERLEEARRAAEDGADPAAAAALRGAAERVTEGSRAVLGSGLVDPTVDLAEDLSAQVALLEELRPDLGAEGTEAADALMAVILEATEGVLEVIDVSQWPGSVPTLSDPAVPQQTPEATTTPVPGVTTPPVDASTPGGASATPTEQPTGASLGTADAQVPDVSLPSAPRPGEPLPGVPAPQPGQPAPVGPETIPVPSITDPVDGVGDGVGDAVDGVGDAVDGVGAGVGDAVDGVGAGVGDAVGGIGDGVGGAVDGVGDAVDGVGGTVDDVIEDVGGLVPDSGESAPDPVQDPVEDPPGVDDLLPGLGG